MSEENVEIVRRAWEVGAAQGLDAVADLLDRNVECSPPESAPTAGTYRGLDEIKVLIGEWSQLFEGFGFDPERFVDAGDQVVVFGRQRGRGKTSGADIGESQVHVPQKPATCGLPRPEEHRSTHPLVDGKEGVVGSSPTPGFPS
jgi:ketosteroid isomerase-like protein